MARVPVIRIIGKRDSGKTRLIASITSQLVHRGYRVSVIKHSMHRSSFDQPGKDTWRFSRAGSSVSALCCPNEIVIVKRTKKEPRLEDVVSQTKEDADIILVEGFKNAKGPKIEIRRKGERANGVKGLIAVVGNPNEKAGVPQFGFRENTKLVDLLEATFLARRTGRKRYASHK